MPTERLAENLAAVLAHLREVAPRRLRRVRISATMSPAVELHLD
ncbi:MAG: hypothetical protein AB7N76_02435 [Planctomycetota bacterium]